MKILLAVDGSAFTKRMLAWLSANDEWLAGRHSFTVVTVTAQIPPHVASMFSAEDLKNYYNDTTESVFKPIRKFMARQKAAVTFTGKVGNAAEVIAKLAEKDKFDMVIMGSHGRGNLMNMVAGSVATQVLARCKTPVLLVR